MNVQVGISELTQLGTASREQMEKVQSMDLHSALGKRWTWDAMAMPFFVRANDEDHFIRVAVDSPLLTQIHEASNSDILTQSLFLDYDLPNHARWWAKPEYAIGWVEKLYEDLELLPSATYTTEHCARLVYRLSEPISVFRVEGIVNTILQEFGSQGIHFDTTCNQSWRRVW